MYTKILITGANGFLGSAITNLALKKKFKVNVLVRENTNLKNLEKISSKLNFFYGDLRDINSLDLPILNSDVIFHVAADYRLWSRNPKEIYDSNVRGTENICLKVKELKKTLIYTSSVATLGIDNNSEADENTPVDFIDMIGDYKKSKYLAEQIVQKFIKKKMKGIIVNPSTPIGPGDIKPTPTGKIILDVLSGRMPAYVDTGLNLVHVEDVAEGHFQALKFGKFGEKYILGGENLNFKEFLDQITELSGKPEVKIKLNPKYLMPFANINEFLHKFIFTKKTPSLTVDSLKMSQKKMFFSSEKAKKKLRYRPRSVKNAIKDSVQWFKKFDKNE